MVIDTNPLREGEVVRHLHPAEAATEVGLDLDGDGQLWWPAPLGTLVRPLAVALALVASTAALVFGPDWLAALQLGFLTGAW